MDAVIPHSIASLAALAVAASYLNARFAIGCDLRDIRYKRDIARRKQQRIACAKGTHSMYAILQQSGNSDEDEAIWFEGKTMSYGQLKMGKLTFPNLCCCFLSEVDQFAGLLHARGIRIGDVVGVFMTNSPEMVVAILALAKLGVVVDLINTNHRDDTFHAKVDLPHICLALSSFAVSAETPIPPKVELIGLNDLQNASHVNLVPAKRSLTDMAVLICTSGEPKACVIRNDMLWATSTPFTGDMRDPSKYHPLRTYSSLPPFHSTAFLAGLCYTLGPSGTFCLARKFSATTFWEDVNECRANRILYVGELCRFLLAAPPSPYDRSHSVTHAFGNGLREDVWDKFKERFGVREIREAYRATEAVTKFENDGRSAAGKGKVGFAGPLKRYFEDVTFVVKYDPEMQMPVRDPNTGFCIKADLGEEGEVIGRVSDLSLLTTYLNDDAATEGKLLRDVFRRGDLFQRMGDLVMREESGWVKFQERIDDRFRWQGQNVSTGEVRSQICMMPNVMDAAVFGVKLDSYEGKVGAAVIALYLRTEASETEFINSLRSALVKSGLPHYALPRLVRMTNSIITGVTFKQIKSAMEKLSWNPNTVPTPEERSGDEEEDLRRELVHDTLYWLNPAKGYQRLDALAWSDIQWGTAKL
ncbi:long-chain acyl-CoA synthetase [Histoplasma capsulatum H143]|uniref:Long-chain acyl-CoA synthetase n=1 Tax=Ajellomyces capsulatus (strain H143) TaxID=544712 RepID=C6H359_AJECH|nr:long-chain acyl-CoA synthetase [Histoplasma capsulatum H143]